MTSSSDSYPSGLDPGISKTSPLVVFASLASFGWPLLVTAPFVALAGLGAGVGGSGGRELGTGGSESAPAALSPLPSSCSGLAPLIGACLGGKGGATIGACLGGRGGPATGALTPRSDPDPMEIERLVCDGSLDIPEASKLGRSSLTGVSLRWIFRFRPNSKSSGVELRGACPLRLGFLEIETLGDEGLGTGETVSALTGANIPFPVCGCVDGGIDICLVGNPWPMNRSATVEGLSCPCCADTGLALLTGLLSSMIRLISRALELVALVGSFSVCSLSCSSPGRLIDHGFSCSSALLGMPPAGLTFLELNVPRPETGLWPWGTESDSYSAFRSSVLRLPIFGLRLRVCKAATRGVIFDCSDPD